VDKEVDKEQALDLASWRPAAGEMTAGPVELWVIVFTDDGAFMGAARAARQPAWLWRGGRLCCDYSPVHVLVQHPGRYQTGLICAVSPQSRTYRPLWPISLGPSHKLRRGDNITITDGIIALTPELPGPHG
jgi:hypothetical protein